MTWEITVKIVGSLPTSTGIEESKPNHFTVSVEPGDMISSLYKKIEHVTGLGMNQQRIIYRGRMIRGNPVGRESMGSTMTNDDNAPVELRISDVDGLENGHTIHLVPRPAETTRTIDNGNTEQTDNGTSASRSNQQLAEVPDPEAGTAFFGGSGGGGLLAALLGIGLGSPSIQRNDDGDDDYDIEAFLSSVPLGNINSRPTRNARRRPNSHRRTAMDERYPNPCPLEPVRQGLMTIHTMIGSQSSNAVAPFLVKRKFYRGQWLDVRDTVNQWLEATVVEVMMPDDILVRTACTRSIDKSSSAASTTSNNPQRPAMDPAIGANDHKGRLRLLLEESEEESDCTLSDLNRNDDLIGWKERDNNDTVQLLLVHYNGWPHRWDEWIRSDSERIRPFRTRSKHEPNRGFLSPSPESTFHSAPSTYVKSDDDSVDRIAILPELHRSLTDVQNIFAGAIRVEDSHGLSRCAEVLTSEEQSDLSDAIKVLQPEKVEQVMTIVQGAHEGGKDMDPCDIEVKELDNATQWRLKRLLQSSNELSHGEQLPWKSRISYDINKKSGRCERLTNCDSESDHPKLDKNKLEALAPLLDRLGRIMIDAAPHVASIADSLPGSDQIQDVTRSNETAYPGTMLPENLGRPLRPAWSDFHSEEQNSSEFDSDYADFIHGFINHRHNHVLPPRRSRQDQNESNLGSTLLSAYLASAMNDRNSDGADDGRNGTRVVRIDTGTTGRSGGTAGSGMGIHIHAVVTGSGGLPAPGLPNLEGSTDPIDRTRTNTNTEEASHQNDDQSTTYEPQHANSMDDEENGLFDDLYSEEPVSTETSPTSWRNIQDEIDDDGDSGHFSTLSPETDHHQDQTSAGDSLNNNDIMPPLYEPNDNGRTSHNEEPQLQIDSDGFHSNDEESASVIGQGIQGSINYRGDVTSVQEDGGRRAPLFARFFRRTMQRRSTDS